MKKVLATIGFVMMATPAFASTYTCVGAAAVKPAGLAKKSASGLGATLEAAKSETLSVCEKSNGGAASGCYIIGCYKK
jgi:hypothetical protein